jgi:hypothetical protein
VSWVRPGLCWASSGLGVCYAWPVLGLGLVGYGLRWALFCLEVGLSGRGFVWEWAWLGVVCAGRGMGWAVCTWPVHGLGWACTGLAGYVLGMIWASNRHVPFLGMGRAGHGTIWAWTGLCMCSALAGQGMGLAGHGLGRA